MPPKPMTNKRQAVTLEEEQSTVFTPDMTEKLLSKKARTGTENEQQAKAFAQLRFTRLHHSPSPVPPVPSPSPEPSPLQGQSRSSDPSSSGHVQEDDVERGQEGEEEQTTVAVQEDSSSASGRRTGICTHWSSERSGKTFGFLEDYEPVVGHKRVYCRFSALAPNVPSLCQGDRVNFFYIEIDAKLEAAAVTPFIADSLPRRRGVVLDWNEESGIGFVKDDEAAELGDEEVILLQLQLNEAVKVASGDFIEYCIFRDKKRILASEIVVVEHPSQSSSQASTTSTVKMSTFEQECTSIYGPLPSSTPVPTVTQRPSSPASPLTYASYGSATSSRQSYSRGQAEGARKSQLGNRASQQTPRDSRRDETANQQLSASTLGQQQQPAFNTSRPSQRGASSFRQKPESVPVGQAPWYGDSNPIHDRPASHIKAAYSMTSQAGVPSSTPSGQNLSSVPGIDLHHRDPPAALQLQRSHPLAFPPPTSNSHPPDNFNGLPTTSSMTPASYQGPPSTTAPALNCPRCGYAGSQPLSSCLLNDSPSRQAGESSTYPGQAARFYPGSQVQPTSSSFSANAGQEHGHPPQQRQQQAFQVTFSRSQGLPSMYSDGQRPPQPTSGFHGSTAPPPRFQERQQQQFGQADRYGGPFSSTLASKSVYGFQPEVLMSESRYHGSGTGGDFGRGGFLPGNLSTAVGFSAGGGGLPLSWSSMNQAMGNEPTSGSGGWQRQQQGEGWLSGGAGAWRPHNAGGGLNFAQQPQPQTQFSQHAPQHLFRHMAFPDQKWN